MIYGFLQGFSPVFPALLIILLAVFSLFIAWWTYNRIESIKPYQRWGLIGLRAAALFILILLLLNPYLIRQQFFAESPAVAVYLDNSQSLSVDRGSYNGLDSYNEILELFRQARDDNFRFDTFYFDESVHREGELDATGTRTNIHEVMDHIRVNENQYRAAFLFSDGLVTQGRNPFFAAQHLSIPVITIPVGDTTTVRDIAVANVEYIQTVYTYTRQTIRAEVQQEGFEGEEITVQFIKDGEVADTETVEFTTALGSYRVNFSIEPEEPGFYDFEINIPPKPEEFTDQNNRETFTIEVLDDKTQVLSLAFEVHPDVGSVRRLIASDQQYELTSTTYLGNNRFTDAGPRDLDESFELIVLHGLPATDSALFEWLSDQQTPILYIATPRSFEIKHQQNNLGLIGYRTQNRGTPVDVQIENFTGGLSHPLLEVDAVSFQRLPSLKSSRTNYQLSPAAQELAGLLFQRTETNIPLLISEDTSVRRKASVNAYEWHRFERNRQEETRTFFQQFFTNLISWTSTPPDQRLLTLEPTKSEFTENEQAGVRAYLLNERGEPEPDALIEVSVFDGSSDEVLNRFRMNHSQNELYEADLGTYPQGVYRAEAAAVKNDRTIATAETRINVRQSSIEFLNTRRDDNVLASLADITDGLFLENLNFDEAMEFLNEWVTDQPEEEITEDFIYLHRNGFWFFVVIMLLGSEWLLRRYVSLP